MRWVSSALTGRAGRACRAGRQYAAPAARGCWGRDGVEGALLLRPGRLDRAPSACASRSTWPGATPSWVVLRVATRAPATAWRCRCEVHTPSSRRRRAPSPAGAYRSATSSRSARAPQQAQIEADAVAPAACRASQRQAGGGDGVPGAQPPRSTVGSDKLGRTSWSTRAWFWWARRSATSATWARASRLGRPTSSAARTPAAPASCSAGRLERPRAGRRQRPGRGASDRRGGGRGLATSSS